MKVVKFSDGLLKMSKRYPIVKQLMHMAKKALIFTIVLCTTMALTVMYLVALESCLKNNNGTGFLALVALGVFVISFLFIALDDL